MLFRHRGVVFGAIGLIVVALAQPTQASLALGVPVLLAGLLLRLWAFAHLGPAGRTRDPAAPATRTVSGPYRWVAHPVYLANGLVAGGVLAAASPPSPIMVGSAGLVAAGYAALALRESRQLAGVPARSGLVLTGRRLLRSERSTWLSVGLLLSVVLVRV